MSHATARPEPDTEPRPTRVRLAARPPVLLGGLSLTLVVLCVVSAGSGQLDIPTSQVVGSILQRIGIDGGPVPEGTFGEDVLWQVRFPRIALAVIVGAALACAGALLQGIFGNPLAEPGVIGISSGAAVGAFTAIVLNLTVVGSWTVPAAAFLGGLVTTVIVYSMARSGGRTEVVTLILTGIAVNAATGACIGLLTFLSDDDSLRAITFWNLGSLSAASWPAVIAVLPFAVAGIVVAIRVSHQLDLLALGERSARHLGLDVERLRIVVIIVAAGLTSSAVAFTGIILFVGLIVPHLIRLAAGPGHRLLIPASALGGACVLVGADLFARTLVPYQELPLGVLTSLVGGPFFFWLLRRTRTRAGGWA